MFFDSGLTPVITLFVAFSAFVILIDLLLTVFSQRLSLSSGSLQNWLYDHLGQSLFGDALISFCFLLLSFRKRSFFVQIAGFINVGSFSRGQILMLLGGAVAGGGFSVLFLSSICRELAVSLIALGFFFSLLPGEKKTDFGVSLLSLGAVMVAFILWSQYLGTLQGKFLELEVSNLIIVAVVVFLALGFQTVFPFLSFVALLLYLNQIDPQIFPILFALFGSVFFASFYRYRNRRRMGFAIRSLVFWQICQLCIGAGILKLLWSQNLLGASTGSSFLEAFWFTILCYFLFQMSHILVIPFVALGGRLGYFSERSRPKESQKIIAPVTRGRVFSLHLSLILLRQEFVKMATLVHTLLKFGRETENTMDEAAKKLEKYRSVLERVGTELKELCFSVGKQKAYRSHIQEILSTYKTVIQLELMVEDMSFFIGFLQQKALGEDLERECRYWLNLQLKIYEVFFNELAVPGLAPIEPVDEMAAKAYEVIDRIVREVPVVQENRFLSKALHRITDGNTALAGVKHSKAFEGHNTNSVNI